VNHGDRNDCKDEIQNEVDGTKRHDVCGTVDAYRMMNLVPARICCHPESVDRPAGE